MLQSGNPQASQLVIIDLVLFILSFPFMVCDFYYANRDYSCVWVPIKNYSINFPLKTWLKADGAMMFTFIIIMLILAIILCTSPGLDFLYIVHTVVGGILAVFRFTWLIIGAVLFWGYLTKDGGLCAPNVRGYMYANLILGFILLPLFFIASFMYTTGPGGNFSSPPPMRTHQAIPSAPTFRGTNAPTY